MDLGKSLYRLLASCLVANFQPIDLHAEQFKDHPRTHKYYTDN